MAEEEKDKQLDELLDSMLSRYAAEEPRPGLETRVLARIAEDARNSESRIRRSSWFIPGVAFTAATTALLMMLLAFRTTQVRRPLPELGQNGHPPQLSHLDTSARHASTPSSTNRPIHTKKS